ncbi:amidohydrolase [Jejuia pallidilutea]|uniref:Omega-amidase YafV n=1 Tax=Jejuia pallidilutea TaxID=504487 RepID=A0A090W4S4_9FLAO|nr:amidohydrolase [Jejuia pallidilutea]GAL67719.1 aliphatic amidase AmiE [Jejuia pallidilutea]GAL71985.1 aliphatic amidase AmiE [Jejuia pallidilutea]GAL88328.1 aliphatic amidase AmiE [Jejuia pallidilutea]
MQEALKIALIQSDLVWENPEQNQQNFTKKINAVAEKVDIIVLPEMFTSGFTMNAKAVAETMEGTTVSWMLDLAKTKQAAIAGSMVVIENDNYYNRFLFAEPSGKLFYYDKRHTFTLAGEHKVYKAGNKKIIIDYRGWKICPLICYDLRFPVWARNTEDYDVLLYVANWPKPRINAWDTLLKARAIENMSYCIGVNRIGVDGVNAEYNGSSACYDVLGKKITNMPLNQDAVEIVALSKNHIRKYRNALKFLDDRDAFNLLT